MSIVQHQPQVTPPIANGPEKESDETKVRGPITTQKTIEYAIPITFTVKEISEILAEYDATKYLTFSIKQFIDRINKARQVYECEEKLFLIAEYGKIKGPAKYDLIRPKIIRNVE